MTLERRNGQLYYYRSVRDGEKVRKVYVGTGGVRPHLLRDRHTPEIQPKGAARAREGGTGEAGGSSRPSRGGLGGGKGTRNSPLGRRRLPQPQRRVETCQERLNSQKMEELA